MTTDDELLEQIQAREPFDSSDDARDALEAVMKTIGERITEGQAEDLAETFPEVAATPLLEVQGDGSEPAKAEDFSTREFLERVQDRSSVDAQPLPATRAVLAGVRETVDDTELERTREQLPGEFGYFFDAGEPMSAETFLERVGAELPADVDPDLATRATLETLGERITGGEAIDLSTYLPREIRDPLIDAEEDATQFDRAQFLEHVAFRADVDESEAMDVARAVLAALRETAAEAELQHVRTQLPNEFDPLFEG